MPFLRNLFSLILVFRFSFVINILVGNHIALPQIHLCLSVHVHVYLSVYWFSLFRSSSSFHIHSKCNSFFSGIKVKSMGHPIVFFGRFRFAFLFPLFFLVAVKKCNRFKYTQKCTDKCSHLLCYMKQHIISIYCTEYQTEQIIYRVLSTSTSTSSTFLFSFILLYCCFIASSFTAKNLVWHLHF